ncbi:MAG: hypothetical protein JW836_13950 [Deltaproteobacteria bacterium]|nr:hypothetical protein [Deltaproteobacteria bacterium]
MRKSFSLSTPVRLVVVVLCLVLLGTCALRQVKEESPVNLTVLHTSRVTGQVLPCMT